MIPFRAGERKAEVMAPYLRAAAAAGRSRVVAIGCAQEFQLVWTARKRDTDPGGCPQFSFTREQRRVSVFYVYIFDEQMGPGFIKICTYFPYPVKVWVNGHEWAKRQAPAAGIGFTALSNGFASCDDPAALQRSATASAPAPCRCGSSGGCPGSRCRSPRRPGCRVLVGAVDAADRDLPHPGLRRRLSMPARSSRRCCARTWTWAGRRTSSCCSAAASGWAAPPSRRPRRVQDHDRPVLRHGHLERVLQELPRQAVPERRHRAAHRDRHQLPDDLGCNRLLANLPELQAKARAINDRLLHTETAGQGTALVSPVIERITRPTLTQDGRKAPALRFGDLRVQALAGATAAMLFTVTGITNRSLRALMTGLLHRPYSMNQASYDLSRLARNGLIARVPGSNRYTLTRDGLLFAHFYTKVYDHVLRPLMAPDRPNAPPELAAAIDTLDRIAVSHIARPASPPPPDLTHAPAQRRPPAKLRTNVKVVAPKVP